MIQFVPLTVQGYSEKLSQGQQLEIAVIILYILIFLAQSDLHYLQRLIVFLWRFDKY